MKLESTGYSLYLLLFPSCRGVWSHYPLLTGLPLFNAVTGVIL